MHAWRKTPSNTRPRQFSAEKSGLETINPRSLDKGVLLNRWTVINGWMDGSRDDVEEDISWLFCALLCGDVWRGFWWNTIDRCIFIDYVRYNEISSIFVEWNNLKGEKLVRKIDPRDPRLSIGDAQDPIIPSCLPSREGGKRRKQYPLPLELNSSDVASFESVNKLENLAGTGLLRACNLTGRGEEGFVHALRFAAN